MFIVLDTREEGEKKKKKKEEEKKNAWARMIPYIRVRI